MLSALIIALAVIIAALGLRLLPLRLAPYGAGVDQWYWKAFIEEYRTTRKLPPDLPQFILDEAHWYPPLFPLLMSWLPKAVFENHSTFVAIAIDIVRLALMLGVFWWRVGDLTGLAVAGTVYAFTPILVTYNVQLNPRGLGALFLDITVLLAIFVQDGELTHYTVAVCGLVGGIILLTHKMTTQLMAFILLSAFALTFDWRYLTISIICVASAMLLSGGYYLNVLRAHWDIVSFWNRNWTALTAHPVRESPLYRENLSSESRGYHRTGIRGWLRRGIFLTAFNPWAWGALVVGTVVLAFNGPDNHVLFMLVAWLYLVLLFSILTTVVPFLKCLGNGYLYVYNAATPSALILGIVASQANAVTLLYAVYATLLALSVASLAAYLNEFRKSRTVKLEAALAVVIAHLKERPDGVVMCFPQHWHDVIAYFSGKKVLFGGHGYGFRKLDPIFPLVRQPICEIIKRYGVRYLVTYKNYLPDSFVNDLPRSSVNRFGDYYLYEFQD